MSHRGDKVASRDSDFPHFRVVEVKSRVLRKLSKGSETVLSKRLMVRCPTSCHCCKGTAGSTAGGQRCPHTSQPREIHTPTIEQPAKDLKHTYAFVMDGDMFNDVLSDPMPAEKRRPMGPRCSLKRPRQPLNGS
jgi:hypothetical protein